MLLINCPHCNTTNRIASTRLQDSPVCGKCKKQLFTGVPLDLNSHNVAATLHKSDIPVVVDCWAPWCGPCESFTPVFSEATKLLEPRARFAKLNTEAVPSIAQNWQIRSIPTLIIFKKGKEHARMAGALPLPQFTQWLAQHGIV